MLLQQITLTWWKQSYQKISANLYPQKDAVVRGPVQMIRSVPVLAKMDRPSPMYLIMEEGESSVLSVEEKVF